MNDNKVTFSSLGLSNWLCNVLKNIDITEPTPIQQKCIPETLKGKVIIGMSETGSGKTAAFVLPILDQLVKDLYGPFALILAPTRELAFQIEKAVHSFSGNFDVRTALVIGGVSLTRQAAKLDTHPHFVIATPGRLEEIIRSYPESNFFKRVRYLVFDEADRILDAKFSLDIGIILGACSPNRQTLLYSATMNAHVKKLAKLAVGKDASRDKVFIYDASQLYRPVKSLKQYYMFVPRFVKECYLYAFLRTKIESKKHVTGIVFMQNMKECELVSRTMGGLGISTVSLHSTKHQRDRLNALESFRKREARVLMCTDVAARGLDIPDVRYVINFDVPEKTDDYIHRIGRTARQGQSGNAISLVSPSEVKRLKSIEKQMRVKLQEYKGFFSNNISRKQLEKEIEEKIYDIAEQRCRSKIKMLEDGFYEQYERRRDIMMKGKTLQKSIRKYFKNKSIWGSGNNMKNQKIKNNDIEEEEEEEEEDVFLPKMKTMNIKRIIPPPMLPSLSKNRFQKKKFRNYDNNNNDGNRYNNNNNDRNRNKKSFFLGDKKKKKKKKSSSNISFGGMTLLKKRKRDPLDFSGQRKNNNFKRRRLK